MVFANQDFQCFEQYGRLVYQDETALLDLDLPPLPGRFQIDNAGLAIAAVRALQDARIGHDALARRAWRHRAGRPAWNGWSRATCTRWCRRAPRLWLDGGHNPSAGRAVATTLADLDERQPRPLVLVAGMLNTKRADGYLKPFAGLVQKVLTIAIPGEENTIPASRTCPAGAKPRA